MSGPASGLKLGAGLDPGKLAAAFARFGRLHLPGVLPLAQARAESTALATATPWHKSMHIGGKGYDFALETRYRAGDFLAAHDDGVEGKNRLYAYVLNFTPAWRTDRGGLLAFHDADGHVAEAYVPTFNALNIFRVPQLHAVTQVASYAAGERLSVTGWIRER
ncbi:2OG-Fe(II) oxygenase family protein [Phenylobacterium sp.]|uniref:2OG-Fe(II) oxygenase family protein n=1 Tax=Phenylobacterium sp. TaxID=1871053 RepID=UPI00273257DE|nr:2OG-Fe(II) oxygenase family protein [Phenylobacterium sp.]MDP3854566.1 2OG-Fe(II) oxygenase family protein [Phenylobacterium sp.]